MCSTISSMVSFRTSSGFIPKNASPLLNTASAADSEMVPLCTKQASTTFRYESAILLLLNTRSINKSRLSLFRGWQNTQKGIEVMDLDEIVEMLPEGWDIYDPEMGLDFLLEAPDGCVIEQDGRCPHGCVSPLRGLGLV